MVWHLKVDTTPTALIDLKLDGFAFRALRQQVRKLDQLRIMAFQLDPPTAAGRQVNLMRHEMRQHACCVTHRRDDQPVPECFAVLAVVQNVGFDRFACGDRA
jgi:hypothetical protein